MQSRTIEDINRELLDLKTDKIEICAEISSLNAQLKPGNRLPPQLSKDLSAKRSDLTAEQAEVDAAIMNLNQLLQPLREQEAARTHHLNSIRSLACAFIQSGKTPEDAIDLSVTTEHLIQQLIPRPSVSLELTDEESPSLDQAV